MFYGPLLFVDDLEELTVEFVDDLFVDEELDIAADGVADSVGPGPGGADADRLTAGIQLGCQNVRKHDDHGGSRNELSANWERCSRGAAKIREIIEFHTDPLGCPSGPFIKNFLVESDGGLTLRSIQPFPVLETGRHDL